MPLLSIAAALWGNPWTRLAAVAVIAAGFGWVKGFSAVPRVDVAAVTRNAEAGRDAVWQAKLSEQERQAQLALDAAVAAGMSEPAVPADRAERMRDCQRSPTCRDHRK